MTVKQQVDAQLKASRKASSKIQGKPQKAVKWLVAMGMLEKSGKKLARRYR